jgi:hypothetical protein
LIAVARFGIRVWLPPTTKLSDTLPGTTNLIFSDVHSVTSHLEGDIFRVRNLSTRSNLPQRRIFLFEIKNASRPSPPVEAARDVKAELIIKTKERNEIYGPLPWAESSCNTDTIEMSETKQVVLAVNFPAGDWSVPKNSRSWEDNSSGTKLDYQTLLPRPWTDVEVNILDVAAGTIMKTFPGQYQWDTDNTRPEFKFDLG